MSPAYLQQLIRISDAAASAPHGKKEPIYQAACEQLGIARATLLNHLKKTRVTMKRKTRSDAGKTCLTLKEASIISSYCSEGYRKNQRKITGLKEALTVLRGNGEIIAGTVNAETGEITYLTETAVHRALRSYRLHPEQLRRATPHTPLKSKHPNHCWQVDASVCVIYYLPDTGLVELEQAVHYKNKPENLKKIEQFRVIRYVMTDHTSGLIRFRYYPHAESGEHTVHFMAWAMAPKENDPFQGVPKLLMVDPGATSGGLVKRFCQRMGIELIINKVHNARAKGSVEKGNHLIETTFEQALRYLDKKRMPKNFEQINTLAQKFQIHWNRTAIHTRHNKPRMEVWMTITSEQLKTTPSADKLLQLATHEPEKRQVRGDLTVSFKGRQWNVEAVPNVMIKDDVFVHWHPFMHDTAMAVVTGEDGHEQHIALAEIKKDEFGFADNAAVIGQQYKAPADTIADKNRKMVNKIAAVESSQEATDKKRKRKCFTPFDGEIDPLIALKTKLPTLLPRHGTVAELPRISQQMSRYNPTKTALWLKGRLGADYSPSHLAIVKKQYPAGATEQELEQVLADLAAGHTPAGRHLLKII